MTDPTKSNPDELDAGWDVSPAPIPDLPVQSQPPTAVLAAIDAGWDSPPPPTEGEPSRAATAASQASAARHVQKPQAPAAHATVAGAPPTPTAITGDKPLQLSKKDRRRLEREARAHQVARDLENRKQRKAERQQMSEQRAVELQLEREQLRQREQEREQERTARRAKSMQTKPKRQKQQVRVAPSTELQPDPIASGQVQPGAPNRAARRAKSANSGVASIPTNAVSAAAKKQYAIGPFALFIGVVLVASLLSYYFIR